jgi:hypothetical protein
MIESVLLFFVGIGALLVSIVSILRLAWLAVLIPVLIAAGAAYGLFVLNDHRSPRPNQATRHTEAHPEKSRRMAA